MTFEISFGVGGLAGWKAMQRSEATHLERLAKDRIVKRDLQYFNDKFDFSTTAEDLVKDYRMRRVVLEAFGLEEDLGNGAFIRRVLESDTNDEKSVANKLSDKRYQRLAEAFNFYGRHDPEVKKEAELDKEFKRVQDKAEAEAKADAKIEAAKKRKSDLVSGGSSSKAEIDAAELEVLEAIEAKEDAKSEVATEAAKVALIEARAREGHASNSLDRRLARVEVEVAQANYIVARDARVKTLTEELNLARKTEAKATPAEKAKATAQVEFVTKQLKKATEARDARAKIDDAEIEKAVPTEFLAGSRISSEVTKNFINHEFERRVGRADESLRLGLNARREIQAFASRDVSEKTLWLDLIGTPPLRKVFETAFGLSLHYGKLPVDRQVEEFRKASERLLGTSKFADIASTNNIDKLVETFLVRDQIAETTTQNRYSTVLRLLGV